MNTYYLCQRLGKITLGQLDDAIEIIEKINVLLADTSYVDEDTSGEVLMSIYQSASPDIKSTLRTTSILEGNAVLELIKEIDRLKTSENLIQEREDTIKDIFTGAIVVVFLVLAGVLVYSFTGNSLSGESYEGSLTVSIIKGLLDIINWFI